MKFRKLSSASNDGPKAVVASGRRPVLKSPKLVPSVIAVFLVALTAGVWFYVQHQQNVKELAKAETLLAGISINSMDYTSMTPEQVSAQLKRQTGKSITDLKNHNITSTTFKNFDNAHKSALALRATKNYDKAMQAYAMAEKKGSKSASFGFYNSYALYAEERGDKALAIRLFEKVKQMYVAEHPSPSEDEGSAVESLDARIKWLKESAQ